MASRISKPKSTFKLSDHPDSLFEFDEADVWSTFAAVELDPSPAEPRKWTLPRKFTAAKSKPHPPAAAAASSMPVNVPDWSKILKDGGDRMTGRNGMAGDFSDEEEFGDGDRVPPHEYLARTRGASFSVHEGIGRTLKGRDLRRVRNAIWKRVGFED